MQSKSVDGIACHQSGPVLTMEIDRPTARNALDRAAVLALHKALNQFDQDDSAKVAVLHGRHGAFCAGADLKEVSEEQDYVAWAGSADGVLGAPRSKPLVAAVEGHAVAGGLGLALYCDIRIADTTAVFGVFCRRFGVPMSDGTTVRLPRLIGESRAMHMMLTGRAVKADEALHMGLVAEVVERGGALTRAQQLALELTEAPPIAMLSDRQSLLASRGLDLDTALRQEAQLAERAKREEASEGARRFAEGKGRHGASD